MASVVWKQVLELPEDVSAEVEVPQDAVFLTAREQHDKVCVWYRCNPDLPKIKRRLEISGTGHPAPHNATYLGLAALRNGHLMLHVWLLN